jgi:hypothetical protein
MGEVLESRSRFQTVREEDCVPKLFPSNCIDRFDFVILPLEIWALVAYKRLMSFGTVDHDRSVLQCE